MDSDCMETKDLWTLTSYSWCTQSAKNASISSCIVLETYNSSICPSGLYKSRSAIGCCFKQAIQNLVDAQFNEHFEANLDAWVLGKISASERRILMTNWIGTAWERFCDDYKDAIRASFIKCGIALPIDGSQDALINIRGLDIYTIPPWQSNPLLDNYVILHRISLKGTWWEVEYNMEGNKGHVSISRGPKNGNFK